MNLSYSFFYKEKKINIGKVYVSIIIQVELSKLTGKDDYDYYKNKKIMIFNDLIGSINNPNPLKDIRDI